MLSNNFNQLQTTKDNNIWHYVIHLLHIHDCVVIPNFGGFLLHTEYASIDNITEIIYPKNRIISFNQKLYLNDGLLATYLADEFKISYSDSIKLIDMELRSFNLLISEKKRIEIETLGTFILNNDNIVQFLPNSRSNYLKSSFGLQPLQLNSSTLLDSPITLPLVKSTSSIKNEEKIKSIVKNRRKRSGVWYTLLATFMIIVLLFNAYILLDTYPVIPLRNAILKMNLSSKIEEIFTNKSPELKIVPVIVSKKEVISLSDKIVPQVIIDTLLPIINSAIVDEPILTSKENNITHSVNSGDSIYYIVVGAFRHNKKATVLSTQMKENGYPSSEVVNPHRYRFKLVTVGGFLNMNDVNAMLNNVLEEIPDAWVYRSIKP